MVLHDISYLLTNEGVIVDVGQAFTELTGFDKADLFQKEISDVFKLLRINCYIQDLSNIKEIRIFTFSQSHTNRGKSPSRSVRLKIKVKRSIS